MEKQINGFWEYTQAQKVLDNLQQKKNAFLISERDLQEMKLLKNSINTYVEDQRRKVHTQR